MIDRHVFESGMSVDSHRIADFDIERMIALADEGKTDPQTGFQGGIGCFGDVRRGRIEAGGKGLVGTTGDQSGRGQTTGDCVES